MQSNVKEEKLGCMGREVEVLCGNREKESFQFLVERSDVVDTADLNRKTCSILSRLLA